MKKILLFNFMILSLFALSQTAIIQTDWSGGSGQTTFTDYTMFNSQIDMDYTQTPGEISLIENTSNSFYGIVEYKDKIIIGSNAGVFIYNPTDNTWEHSISGNLILTNATIHEEILYVMYGNNIYTYDDTENDYGLGPNGWKHFSDLTPLGITSTFTIESIDGDLLIGARRDYNGYVLKWNSGTQTWDNMGGSFSNGAYSFAKYGDELYVGTHWSGTIYKWNGSYWATAYDTPMMTITDLLILDGKLYACGTYTDANLGKIYVFDGTNWAIAYDGFGIRKMAVHNNNLVFSVQRSTDSNSNNLPGQIFTYDGTTSTATYTLATETYAYNLLSYGGNLYYGGYGYSLFGGVPTSDFYKNDQVLKNIFGGYVISSDIENPDNGWGTIEYDIIENAESGVFVTLREKDENDNYSLLVESPSNSTISFTEDKLQYIAYFWGFKDATLASMQEIIINTTINVGHATVENPLFITMYPNPSNGIVKIKLNNISNDTYNLHIYNYLGKLVYIKDGLNSELINLDLKHLSKGVYFVELANKSERTIQKLEIY